VNIFEVENQGLDHRTLLREELLERMSKRRSYSSNAFARDLGLSRGFFSQVLNKKRKLSEKTALAVLEKLSWRPRKQKLFMDLVRFDLIDSTQARNLLWKDIEQQITKSKLFSNLDVEQFKLISNWYHFAILELCDIEGFQSDVKWIGQKLGISEYIAKDAIDRLVSLKLLEYVDGNLRKAADNAIRSIPSEAIKRFHEQHLENAKKALKDCDFALRDFSGTTVCTSPKQMEKARKLIKEFRSELTEVLEAGPKTHIYHLAVQLFPLSKG
jgi:uncharacterized protein (TIGR02147 family)